MFVEVRVSNIKEIPAKCDKYSIIKSSFCGIFLWCDLSSSKKIISRWTQLSDTVIIPKLYIVEWLAVAQITCVVPSLDRSPRPSRLI